MPLAYADTIKSHFERHRIKWRANPILGLSLNARTRTTLTLPWQAVRN